MRGVMMTAMVGGVSLFAVHQAKAQAPSGTGTVELSTTAADWGGSSETSDPNQVGWGGWGGFSSGSPGQDTQGNTVLYPTGSFTDSSTSNGLVNIRDDFAESTLTPYVGSFSPSGAAEITDWSSGGFDGLVSSEEAPGGTGQQNAPLINAVANNSWVAFDFTTPFGGTTLDPNASANQDYYIVGFETQTAGTKRPKDVATQIAVQNLYTQASPDPGSNGDTKGAFLVNNGTYFTAYIPYSYALGTFSTGSFTSWKLELTVNSGGNTDGYAATGGNIYLDNLRVFQLVTPEPASLGLVGTGAAVLGLTRRRRIA